MGRVCARRGRGAGAVGGDEADSAYARQSLAAMVAKSWFLAIEAGLQRAARRRGAACRPGAAAVAQERLRVGVGNDQAVAEAAANVGGVRDTLRQTVQARDEALRALELLLGRYPSAEIAWRSAWGDAGAGARSACLAICSSGGRT